MSECCWCTFRLRDFININPKVTLKKDGIYSFIEMKDLSPSHKYVSPSCSKVLNGGSRFSNGDTLFARITPCLENGKICQVWNLEDNVGFGSTEFIILRGRAGVSDSNFVYYLCRSEKIRNAAIKTMTGTSGRQRVDINAFKEIEFEAPSDVDVQSSIASILSSLDDKIELNLRMNKTLEAIAQAIFKEWFVDFRFPGFDGELVDGVPKGWKGCIISDFGKIVCGKTPPKTVKEFFGGNIMFIKIPDMHDAIFVIKTTDTLTLEGANSQSKKYLPPFSICVSSIATVGLVSITSDYCQTNQQINAIIPTNDSSKYYLFYLTKSLRDTFLATASGGTATLNMNTSQFSNIRTIMPSDEIIRKFDITVGPLMQRILSNCHEINTLSYIRDTLLPRLMTGKILVA